MEFRSKMRGNETMIKKMLAVAIGLMMMGIIGCSRDEAETAADKAKDVAHDAATATEEAAHSTAEAGKEMVHDAAEATEETAHDVKKSME